MALAHVLVLLATLRLESGDHDCFIDPRSPRRGCMSCVHRTADEGVRCSTHERRAGVQSKPATDQKVSSTHLGMPLL